MFALILDDEVFRQDFRRIAVAEQRRILKAIRKKLTTHPELYGKLLSGSLKGYWKLKIGPYRVVYEISKEKHMVIVAAIGFRRNDEVYLIAGKRLGAT